MITINNLLPNKRHLVIILFSSIIIISFLVSCSYPTGNDSQQQTMNKDVSNLATIPVEINFILKLPGQSLTEDSIVLEILDEVTGLPYNIKRYTLHKVNDQEYRTTLPIPAGSIIKYRYAKISQIYSPEALYDGSPIRYRLFYADRNNTITDILQSWAGDQVDIDLGRLTGTIVDQKTLIPIPDILVSAGGQLTFSDTNGKFVLENLSGGVHNVVFYAMDGKYRTEQQGALISNGTTTPALMNLNPMPQVNVTFRISAPTDALGAPIYMAGNLTQLGNTFSDLSGSMSIKPKRMPQLVSEDDGSFTINLILYAGTDLRYKFTLGDGYWNAEQHSTDGFHVRQLIIPDQDIIVNQDIASWRTSETEPITFQVSIPPDHSPQDVKYIQFKTTTWTEPIQLWPLGSGNYLYILFSPLDEALPIEYRFCRNENCKTARNVWDEASAQQVTASDIPQTMTSTITEWENWKPFDQNSETIFAFVPDKPSGYSTMIELTPQMDPSWRVYAPIGISQIAAIGANTIIFSPQWVINSNTTTINPEIGTTPFHHELSALLNSAQLIDLDFGLYPQIGPDDHLESMMVSRNHSKEWWQHWFESYRRFVLNYANLAEQSGARYLIIGGKSVLPAIPDGIYPDGTSSDVPGDFNENWLELIADIRSTFGGELLWGTNVHQEMDPLPEFIGEFDQIYISMDSPLAMDQNASLETIKSGFTRIIDFHLYEVYRSTQKPITLALAYPSTDNAVQGCLIFESTCYNDGLFLSDEMAGYSIDLNQQALIYNAIFPVTASRDWITGISIRGYDPTLTVLDGSSSISGKPAIDVVQYWFSGLIME